MNFSILRLLEILPVSLSCLSFFCKLSLKTFEEQCGNKDIFYFDLIARILAPLLPVRLTSVCGFVRKEGLKVS